MRVYLQTQNAHGSWVTLLDGSALCARPARGLRGKSHLANRTPKASGGNRVEYELTLALFDHLEASPANARLIDCDTSRVVASKMTVDRDRHRFKYPATPEIRRAPRPVVRKCDVGIMPRIAKWKRTGHLQSWYAGIVMR
ncbi:hypothetical protein [Bradyrhizobium ottawaense]|uniref:Uncharacterized protein n=1 Tax=Bradyrhizobium ottawaense TaxID=931866 RepID=A0ABY0QHA1_9BRAD|nr:hypothetical protein [Bradyrhizobium ottawaense]SDK42943.1 hypothetical protein SAMN05444163_8090 [Bradyrhizobium ottawaense]